MTTTIPQFPTLPGLTYPVKRSPLVQTVRLAAQSGRRFAQPLWPYPLYQYEIDISVLRSSAAYSEFQNFLGFWNTVMTTPGQLFIWVDPDDGTVSNQYIGTGDGSRTQWQAMRTMGGFIEPVTAVLQNNEPIASIFDCGTLPGSTSSTTDNGTLPGATSSTVDNGGITLTHFYVNGTEVDVTIFNGGSLVFTNPPANGSTITWTGIYGWLCQFDDDSTEIDLFMYQLYQLQKLSFTTARPNV